MQRERKRRFGVNAIISDWWWRWRRNVSFSLSASLSLFSALTLSSHAHLWSLKLSLMWRYIYALLVILRKNRVDTLYCWTRQISMDMTAEERKGDWRQRMSFAVDFVQAETQLFSGGPCRALRCEPEHKCKTIATSGLGNRFFQTRLFCGWWRVETSHNHTLTSLCVLSLGP